MVTPAAPRPWIFKIPGVIPVYCVFFFEAFVLGNWIPRIPDVKTLFDFSASQLGTLLFGISMGTLLAFLLGGKIIRTVGLRGGCIIAGTAWAILIGSLPLAPNLIILGLLAWTAGFFVGLLEISMNSAADRLEQNTGRRLMSKAHGFWSLGSLAGALVGARFATLGYSVADHFVIAMGFAALCALISGLFVPRFPSVHVEESSATFKFPAKGMILLCIMPIGIMLIEGAFIDWSALYVKEVLSGSPFAIGSIFAAFAAVMSITRLSGDWLLDRFGPRQVAKYSAISASVGMSIFCLASSVPMAFIGALFSGLGVAIYYPLAISAAARRPGNAEDNVAAMSLFAFSSFMLAPPLIGFVADQIGLRLALALLIPLAAASLLLLNELDAQKQA